jgi:uncharacterized protein (DUF2147 family)
MEAVMKRHFRSIGLVFCLLVMAASLLASCGGGGGGGVSFFLPSNDNAKLSGAWMFVSDNSNLYFTTDGAGTIADVGIVGAASANDKGVYLVTNNTFSISFYNSPDPEVRTYGTLITASTASATVIQGERATLGVSMIKVQDPGACQGSWTGTLTETSSGPTYTVNLTVDAQGTVTSGSIDGKGTIQQGRRLFCDSMQAAGLFDTDAADQYQQLQITGSGNGTAIIGTYGTTSSGTKGSIKLVNTSASALPDNSKLSGVWLLYGTLADTFYLVTNGTGTITDFADNATGAYRAYADNTFTMTLDMTPEVFVAGQLSSATMGSLRTVESVTVSPGLASLFKVSDPGACQGTWIGAISEMNSSTSTTITLTVDPSGAITGGAIEGKGALLSGKLYCESTHAAGFMTTDAAAPYGSIRVSGNGNGAGIAGTYRTDSNSTSGVIWLAKTPNAASPANDKITGPWLVFGTLADTFALVTDGTGTITDFAGLAAGSYSAYADNTFTMTLGMSNVFMSGQLTSATRGSLRSVETGGISPGMADLFQVVDLGACQGTWTGTLTEKSGGSYPVALTVDGQGLITGGTLSTGAVQNGGRLYCESLHSAGSFTTNLGAPYSTVRLAGSGNGSAIVGTYRTSSDAASGSFALTNTGKVSSLDNSRLAGSWLLLGTLKDKFYLVTNGAGTITDFGSFGVVGSPGSYASYNDGTFVLNFFGDPIVSGQLFTSTTGSLASKSGTDGPEGIGSFIKVTDPGACQGTWTGTLTTTGGTAGLALTVDGNGIVTGGSFSLGVDVFSVTGRRLLCESGNSAGLLVIDGSEVQLVGTVTGKTISGIVNTEIRSEAGAFILTRN